MKAVEPREESRGLSSVRLSFPLLPSRTANYESLRLQSLEPYWTSRILQE
jgi:hypothetical protein